jgi:hypothetical protein
MILLSHSDIQGICPSNELLRLSVVAPLDAEAWIVGELVVAMLIAFYLFVLNNLIG